MNMLELLKTPTPLTEYEWWLEREAMRLIAREAEIDDIVELMNGFAV